MSESRTQTEVTMTFSADVSGTVASQPDSYEREEAMRHTLADLVRFQVGISDLQDIDVDISAITVTAVLEHNQPPIWSGTSREELATRLHAAADKTNDAQDHDELHAAGDAVLLVADQDSPYLRRWIEQLQERWVL